MVCGDSIELKKPCEPTAEFGFVIDLADLDTVLAQAAGFPRSAPELLSSTGIFAQVRDAERVDLSLRALALSEEGVEIFDQEDGLIRVRFPMKEPVSETDSRAEFIYGIQDGWLALGMPPGGSPDGSGPGGRHLRGGPGHDRGRPGRGDRHLDGP